MAAIGTSAHRLQLLSPAAVDPVGTGHQTRMIQSHQIVLGRHDSGAGPSADSELIGRRWLDVFDEDDRKVLHVIRH